MRGVIDDKKLENIAAAIREKTGTETTYTPEEMPGGVAEVYDKGMSDSESAFWDGVQASGSRTSYNYAFANWGNEYISPKYKVAPTSAPKYLFSSCANLKAIDTEKFDFSKFTPTFGPVDDMYAIFNKCTSLEVAPELNNQPGSYGYTYYLCSNLHTIPVLRVEEQSRFDATFHSCPKLTEIRIEGTIGQKINFSYSPLLSVASMKSIINALKDYSGTDKEFVYTLALTSGAWEKLEAEGATAPSGTKWRKYAESKGWLTA